MKYVADACVELVGPSKYYAQNLYILLADYWGDFLEGCDGIEPRELEESSDSYTLSIHPNPAVERCEIKRSESFGLTQTELSIVDAYGNHIGAVKMQAGQCAKQVDVSTYPAGVYFIKEPGGRAAKFLVVK